MIVSPESQVPDQDTTAPSPDEQRAEQTAAPDAPAQPQTTETQPVAVDPGAPSPEGVDVIGDQTAPVVPAPAGQPAPCEDDAPAADAVPAPPVEEPTAPAETSAEPTPVEVETITDQPAPERPEPQAAAAPEAEAPASAPAGTRAPAKPAGPAPTPGMFKGRKPAAVIPATVPAKDPSESMRFGRVAENGAVYVTTEDGEQEVAPEGSGPEALEQAARRYDEVFGQAGLLRTRLETTEMTAGEASEGLKRVRAALKDAQLVGDLKALDAEVTAAAALVSDKSRKEQAEREAARAQAREAREALVVEAEQIAAQPPARTQWKNSGARMRELLDEWKRQQKESVRIDKDSENALWTRFSAARNGFDRARRAWFAELDQQHASAKAAKEDLVARAEALSTSTDWRSTPAEFRRLMDEWRGAGRAARADDDKLWERFRAAQQRFFDAKDQVVAAENEEFAGNLQVKEQLLVEAEALLPITDLDATKRRLGDIQDRWEKAGKVPRADMGRVEGRLKAVEQAVRDTEDKKWKRTNPELQARASSMVEQLEVLVAKCEQDLTAAREAGDTRKIAEAEKALAARQAWLEQARTSLQESQD